MTATEKRTFLFFALQKAFGIFRKRQALSIRIIWISGRQTASIGVPTA
jgi:hypothetical protein